MTDTTDMVAETIKKKRRTSRFADHEQPETIWPSPYELVEEGISASKEKTSQPCGSDATFLETAPLPARFLSVVVSQAKKRRTECFQPQETVWPSPYILSTPTIPTLGALPDESLAEIFSYSSDAEVVIKLSVLCKDFYAVICSCDEFLWKVRCERLWKGKDKRIVERAAKNVDSFRQKYMKTIEDSHRTDLSEEELCAYTWGFRFKANAGEFFTGMDPHWSNEGLMLRTFRLARDGESPTVVSPQGPDLLETWAEENDVMPITWRFTKTRRGEDGTVRRGKFLQIKRWPSHGIERGDDWSWIIQNQWAAYVYPPTKMAELDYKLESEIDRWL